MLLSQHSTSGAALVTGAAKRVGGYIAKVIASNNYDVIIHYNNSKKEALQTKEHIEKHYPVKVQMLQCDFLKFNSIKGFVEDAFDVFPHLNVLINNASIFKKSSFMDSKASVFDAHIGIHLKAPFFLLKEFCDKKRCCNIINMVDANVLKRSSEDHFSYLLAKKSMLVLSNMLEDKLKQNNSVINSIMPGRILNASGDCAKNFFILQRTIKYLLHTNENGLRVYI